MILSLADGGVTASHTGKGICSSSLITACYSSNNRNSFHFTGSMRGWRCRHIPDILLWRLRSLAIGVLFRTTLHIFIYCYSQICMDILITILDLLKWSLLTYGPNVCMYIYFFPPWELSHLSQLSSLVYCNSIRWTVQCIESTGEYFSIGILFQSRTIMVGPALRPTQLLFY